MNDDAESNDVAVPSHVAALVMRILDGWEPTTATLTRPTRFVWAERDFSSEASRVAIEGDALEIHGDDFMSLFFTDRDALRNKPFTGVLEDGRTFAAESAFLDVGRASGHYWTLLDARRPARLWVARVEGLDSLNGLGNLVVTRNWIDSDGTFNRSGSAEHHRFQGAYTYYFVKRVDPAGNIAWFLIVDTGTSPTPLRDQVYPDVLALQFAFGQTFYFDLLHGVDEANEEVGIVGGRHGRDRRARAQTHTPTPFSLSRPHWPSAFFAAISATYRARPAFKLHIALSFYLDALDISHVEGRYLFLHVALEAFAFRLIKESAVDDPPLVDKPRWKKWLRENALTIKALALDGLGETLYSKIASVAARRASSRVVEDAFALPSIGLAITSEMAAELKNRNTIVHTALMFEEAQPDVDAYLAPIALVRSMLVALIGRVVGYRGAIIGWTRETGRPYADADASWWPVDELTRESALRIFRINDDRGAKERAP